MRHVLTGAAVAAILAALPAQANVLTPPTAGDTPDSLTLGAGSTRLATTSGGFVSSLPNDFTGSYTASVFSDTTNTFGAGDLTFVYTFTNNATSVQDINRVTASSFTGFSTDVGFSATGGTAPDTVDRTSASPVGFNYISGVLPGASSDTLLIETNAHLFVPGDISFINDGVSTNGAFGPAVPEPRTWAMLIIGFALMAGVGLRKRIHRVAF
jgi:hypothetical protein